MTLPNPSAGAPGNPLLVTVGTISSGATAIQADARVLGGAVNITLSTDYAMLCPPGWPSRPAFTGVDAADANYPRTISSGTTFSVLAAEAYALQQAGAGTVA